jgi:signal transduction histidine kinase
VLFAIAAEGLLLTDSASKLIRANSAAAALLNLPPQQLPGRLLAAHVAPGDQRDFRANLDRAVEGGDVRWTFGLIPRGLREVRVQARVQRTPEGLAWSLRENLTRRDEEVADLQRIRLGRVFEAVQDGVVVVDHELRVRFANRAAHILFAPHALVVGEQLPDPWTSSTRRLIEELFAHDAYNAEALVEPDEHTSYWIKAYQSDEGGSAVLLVSDVTVEERRERAERDFIANAAHELQSPLTGISTAVEVLLAGAHEDEETRLRFLRNIGRANDRLTRLLRSLLLLAQAQSGQLALATEEIELRSLLDEVVAAVGVREGVAEADVLCPEDVRVIGHRELLEQAVANLVANAMRHGGGARVILTARPGSASQVILEVTDRGPGLPRDELAQAFDRFYRGGSRTGDGFGLGLSIVREAARAVGGDAELLPNPNGGLIARLTLRSA